MSMFVLVDLVWHGGCAWIEVGKRLQRHARCGEGTRCWRIQTVQRSS
jgi:hypothetical protein